MTAEDLVQFRRAHREMGRLLDKIDWEWCFDLCSCDHPRIEHMASKYAGGHSPCGHSHCDCHDFDNTLEGDRNPLRAA